MIDPRAADQITHSSGGRHPFSIADDQRRLRGRQRRQRSSRRSDIQDGARSFAHRSGVVLAVDAIAVWKRICRTFAPCCGWAGGWSICIAELLRHGSQTDHAGHRRHVRCGPRWSAVAAVQRPLRRIRISSRSLCSRRRRAAVFDVPPPPLLTVPPSGRAARRSSPS